VSTYFALGNCEGCVALREKSAVHLGVDQVLGAAAMAALWRRTFTAERDNRAGPDANAQRRGQISHQLKADLQEVINDGND
jgi:hypothetical protein